MPAYVIQRDPFDPRVTPITEGELEAMAKALNEGHATCCVKGCSSKRIGWEAVDGSLRGIGFCAAHLPDIT